MAFVKTYKKYLKVSALIWAACLVVFVLSYFLLIGPQVENQKNLERRFAESKQEYELAQIASRSDTQAKINEEIEALVNRFEEFVIDYKDAEDLTFDISQIADECQVSSFSVQVNDTQKMAGESDPNNIIEKHFRVSFISEFEEFALFLNSLERHEPVLFVNKFMISQNNQNREEYQVALDLAALVQKQPTAKLEENAGLVAGLD